MIKLQSHFRMVDQLALIRSCQNERHFVFHSSAVLCKINQTEEQLEILIWIWMQRLLDAPFSCFPDLH